MGALAIKKVQTCVCLGCACVSGWMGNAWAAASEDMGQPMPHLTVLMCIYTRKSACTSSRGAPRTSHFARSVSSSNGTSARGQRLDGWVVPLGPGRSVGSSS